MEDLAPTIHRQRLVIEGYPENIITSKQIKQYLYELSQVIEMKALIEPVTHRSEKFGEAGWIHWETSGAHFYAWEQPHLFFSVDIYACKAFDNLLASSFTQKFFKSQKQTHKQF